MAFAPVNNKVTAASIAAFIATPFAAWLGHKVPAGLLPTDLLPWLTGVVGAAIVFAAGWIKREAPSLAPFVDFVDMEQAQQPQQAPEPAGPVFADATDTPLPVDPK